MATFLTDMIKKEYTQDEMFAILFESEQEKKRREMLARVTKTADTHRLKKMKELLAKTSNLEEDKWFRSSCERRGKLVSWSSFASTYSGTIHC